MKEVSPMNKKILVLALSFILLLSGCSVDIKQNDKAIYEALKREVYKKDDTSIHELIKEYKEIAKSDNEPYILVKFIDENIKNVDKKEAVAMILILEEVQKEYTSRYTDELFADNNQAELLSLSQDQLFFDETKVEEIKNADLKELVNKILNGKYKLMNLEGAFYPVIDYEGLKSYSSYLTDEMKDYLEIKSNSSNMPVVIDGEMTISHEELGQRLIETEKYISKYPNSIKAQDALRCYGECLKVYLEGTPNTPIYDAKTGKIKDEVISSYMKLSSNKDLVTSQVISRYIEIIQGNQNIIDDNVLSHVPEVYSSAIASLENME